MGALIYKVTAGILGGLLIAGGVLFEQVPGVRMAVMGPPRATASFRPGAAAAVPFDFYRRSRIFLPVLLNGRAVDAMLDSGAGMTVLSNELAARLGIASEGHISVRTQTGPEPAGYVSGATIEVGGLRLEGVGMLIMDLTGLSQRTGRPVPIILGRDLFDASVVELDFAARRIRLSDPAAFAAPRGAVRLPLAHASDPGTRNIPVSINGLPAVQSLFDLGNGGAAIVSHRYTVAQNLLSGLRTAESMAGSTAALHRRIVGTLASVSFAGQTFRGVPADFNTSDSELPPDGANVGIDLISRFRIAVDYSHDQVFLTPDPAALARPLPKERFGLRYDLAGDRLHAVFVAPGSPAALAGLAAGDDIVSVNGRPIAADYYSRPDFDWTRGPAGTRVALVTADGRRREVVLADYF